MSEPAAAMSVAYAPFDERDKAFAHLERMCDERYGGDRLIILKREPDWDTRAPTRDSLISCVASAFRSELIRLRFTRTLQLCAINCLNT